MKSILLLTVLVFDGAYVFAQTPMANKCVIRYSSVTKANAKKDPQITELGSIDISHVSEGTLIKKSYRLGKTDLYGFVEMLFDDDMQYGPTPTDAVTIDVIINRGEVRNSTSVLAASTAQIAFGGFKRAIVMTPLRQGEGATILMADCQGAGADEK